MRRRRWAPPPRRSSSSGPRPDGLDKDQPSRPSCTLRGTAGATCDPSASGDCEWAGADGPALWLRSLIWPSESAGRMGQPIEADQSARASSAVRRTPHCIASHGLQCSPIVIGAIGSLSRAEQRPVESNRIESDSAAQATRPVASSAACTPLTTVPVLHCCPASVVHFLRQLHWHWIVSAAQTATEPSAVSGESG